MNLGSITDVDGILVGNHHRIEDATLGGGWATGTTVVVAPPGTIGAVDVRGGAPGTRETDLLDPSNLAITSTAIGIGLLAAGIIEALWWIQGRVLGEPRILWRSGNSVQD